MKSNTNLMFFIGIFILNQTWAQDASYEQNCTYFPDKIINSKFKKGYLKNNPEIPPKYWDKSEADYFFGGIGNTYIKKFDLDLLLKNNPKYVHIPTGSYIVLEFERRIKDYENAPDLIIESCKPCGCGFPGEDSAMISVSSNNILFKDLLVVKNRGRYEVDFKDYNIEDIKFLKVTGLSAISHPYGYGLKNIFGFIDTPKKIIESKIPELENEVKESEIIVLKDMLFEFNDSLIRGDEIWKLDSICSILHTKDIDSLLISGHTDSIGNAEYNLRLSKARANSIANYLFENGFRKDKLKVTGYGETRLLDTINGDDPKNRRVEIEIIYAE